MIWRGARTRGLNPVRATMLFGLNPHDPISFVLVPIVFLGIALAACYIPARRALCVQPTIALRSE